MSKNGFFKVHRCLFEHPIWQTSTPEQKVILITLIEMVNFAPKKWEWLGEEYECQRGQRVTSLQKIADECGKGVTIQNVRTALKRFEKYGFLTNESTKAGRLITIVNYCKWQDKEDEANKEVNSSLTDDQQRPNKDLTPNKNIRSKELKKGKDIYSRERIEIINYLNEICGTSYRPNTVKTKEFINARLNEGFTVDDFKTVIYKKAKQWKDDAKMVKFLRPETLFGNKFEGYLNEKTVATGIDRWDIADDEPSMDWSDLFG